MIRRIVIIVVFMRVVCIVIYRLNMWGGCCGHLGGVTIFGVGRRIMMRLGVSFSLFTCFVGLRKVANEGVHQGCIIIIGRGGDRVLVLRRLRLWLLILWLHENPSRWYETFRSLLAISHPNLTNMCSLDVSRYVIPCPCGLKDSVPLEITS